ncbi:hypothetical protein NL676_012446 [Syzygium grande]|nr:hypothetical protein NL676_012446 [Syzygium grande]
MASEGGNSTPGAAHGRAEEEFVESYRRSSRRQRRRRMGRGGRDLREEGGREREKRTFWRGGVSDESPMKMMMMDRGDRRPER